MTAVLEHSIDLGTIGVWAGSNGPGTFQLVLTPDNRALTGGPIVLHSSGEAAMALHVCGQSLSWDVDDEQRLAELVILGVLRAGLAQIRDLTARSTARNLRMITTNATTKQMEREQPALWSYRRQQLCTDMAGRLAQQIRWGHGRPA